MSLWWLSASPEELRKASTCQSCGCGDADIDLGLCYECFCRQKNAQHGEESYARMEEEHRAKLEMEYITEAFQGFMGEGI